MAVCLAGASVENCLVIICTYSSLINTEVSVAVRAQAML